MPPTQRTGRSYGLLALFALVTLVAIMIRLGQWYDAKTNPVSDFHGTIVFDNGRPAGNIKVWIRETVGDLTEEDMLELGLIEKEFEILEEPPLPDEESEDDEDKDDVTYRLPETPDEIQPGSGADFETESDSAGNFTFRNLKRGHRYTIWTENPVWVGPALAQIAANERQQQLPTMLLTKGGVVEITIRNLQTDAPPEIPMVFHTRGPVSPDWEFPKSVGVGEDGVARLKLPSGIHQIWTDTPIQEQELIGANYSVLATHVNEGQVRRFDFGYDGSAGLLIPIIKNQSNGHYYAAFDFDGTWQEAESKAASLYFNSRQGHLLTINSEQEDQFLGITFRRGTSWTAGMQRQKDINWQWATGPEKGSHFSDPTAYQNWSSKWSGQLKKVLYDHYLVWSRDGWFWETTEYKTSHLIVEFSLAK